jgi:5'-nucleotidase
LSNLYDSDTNKPIAGDEIFVKQVNGTKLCFMGLAEEEWVLTQNNLKLEKYKYVDYVSKGRELARKFIEDDCGLIIALTHMLNSNDRILAREVPEIDIILGGHDHEFIYESVTGQNFLLKSGSDFRYLTMNTLKIIPGEVHTNEVPNAPNKHELAIHKNGFTFKLETELIEINSQLPEDDDMLKIVKEYQSKADEFIKKKVSYLHHDFDVRQVTIRKDNTDIANFITDIMRLYMNTDCALLNSGTLRTDDFIYRGEITYETIVRLLPLPYNLVRLNITGAQLHKALENGVSNYPELYGRFPMV